MTTRRAPSRIIPRAFPGIKPNEIEELIANSQVRSYPAGTVLCRENAVEDRFYMILEGEVEVTKVINNTETRALKTLAPGDFFGEMALIDGKRRSADATVLAEARLAVLSREDFLEFIHTNPVVALEMLSAVFARLRRTDELLRVRVSRNVNEEEEKRMTVADRLADMLAEFGGSWKFIGFSIFLILFWIAMNSYFLPKAFDQPPYQMLNLVLAVVAGMQAPIIMMSQNRQSEKDRLRADLDYQVNLKNELSLAEVLRRLDVIESERLPKLFEEQSARMFASNVQSPTSNAGS